MIAICSSTSTLGIYWESLEKKWKKSTFPAAIELS
jgi:hypothetical protein